MNETRQWILHRISGIILAPLYCLALLISLISLSANGNYSDSAIYFFSKSVVRNFNNHGILLVTGFFHAKISLNEIFEDYIHDKKIKNVVNFLDAFVMCIIIPFDNNSFIII